MKQDVERERLDKVLANNGFGSRKQVRALVKRGAVQVNGLTVQDFAALVAPQADRVVVDGEELVIRGDVCLMMNKPRNTVCSTVSDSYPAVFEFLSPEYLGRFPGGALNTVGRLDVDTEGLLLFTSDGDLNHRLTSPKYRIPKTYLVHLRDAVSPAARERYVQKLARGMHIPPEGRAPEADCLPAELVWKDGSGEGEPAAAGEITVYEGKFHEIKRLFAALGNEVTYLKRLSVNGVPLDPALGPGEYRELTAGELALLSPTNEKARSAR